MVSFISATSQIAASACTINGQPADCGKVGGFIAAIFIPIVLVMVLLTVFWVISLIHLIQHEDVPNRVVWLILHFVGLNLLAGIIYFFFVKRPYDKTHTRDQANPPTNPMPPTPTTPQPPAQM